MEFDELKSDVGDMYMVINDQSIFDDFVTTISWEHLAEFIEDIHLIKELTVLKVDVASREQYNELLISYLRNMNKRSAREHFTFVEPISITDKEYDNDSQLVDSMFNLMAEKYEIDLDEKEITLTDSFELTDDVKYLIENYGFNLKVIKG